MCQIVTVSNLTGIHVQTIPASKSRCGITRPACSATNVRRYHLADIERLSVVKAVVDSSHVTGPAPNAVTTPAVRSMWQ